MIAVDDDVLDLARAYLSAGLSIGATVFLLKVDRQELEGRLGRETREPAAPNPERDLHERQWRCGCSRINRGPATCHCGQTAYWVQANSISDRVAASLQALTFNGEAGHG